MTEAIWTCWSRPAVSVRRAVSYPHIRARLIRAATLAQAQGLNHDPDLTRRELALKEWASRLPPEERGA